MSDDITNIASRRHAPSSRRSSPSFVSASGTTDWGERKAVLDRASRLAHVARQQRNAQMLDKLVQSYLKSFYGYSSIRYGKQCLTFKLRK